MSNHQSPNSHTPLHAADTDHAHEVVASHHHYKHPVKGKPSVNLNVTSMVDILFNLLVYFIVTANFSIDEGSLKAKLPPPPNLNAPPSDSLDVGDKKELQVVNSADTYGCILNFKGRPVADFAALRATLEANNKDKNPSGTVDPKFDSIMIKANGKVRWQHVVNAFNQTVGAGYHKVGFSQAAN